ncbi:MAG: flagellar basal body protein FliL [Gammaproteobacteria bacterium]|nr:flagellar basal body protein FliL [Gammaproteobacteria bacterium]
MADEETNETEEVAEKSGGGLMKKLMMGGLALALVGGGVFAGPAVMKMISPPAEEEEVAGEGGEDGEEVAEVSSKPALYVNLHPPLVVNIRDSVGDTHFMQITMEVMARDQELLNSVREHTAVIRNNLILLYGTASYDEVTTRAGKEKLLADGLAEIQAIMLEQVGDDSVEALYFTSLIIQ